MKKLPITKEAFEKSRYFTNKYGKLEYVSESGKLFKTDKGNVLKFKTEARSKRIVLSDDEADVIDKIGYESKNDWFHLIPGANGYEVRANDLQDLCDGACNGGDWTKLFGMTSKEVNVWNAFVDKQGLDPSYKGDVPTSKRASGKKSYATISDFDPEEPAGKFILTLADKDGETEDVSFYMDVQEDWGNVNTSGCFYPCPDAAVDVDLDWFEEPGYGNDEDGYKKIVKVYSVDLKKEMTPEDFGKLCEQYVDWFSA